MNGEGDRLAELREREEDEADAREREDRAAEKAPRYVGFDAANPPPVAWEYVMVRGWREPA